MEDIGILEKSLADGIIFLMKSSMDAYMDDMLLVKAQVDVPHIGELAGDQERSDDEKNGQGKLEYHKSLSEDRIGARGAHDAFEDPHGLERR
jgi:hypothetical protein